MKVRYLTSIQLLPFLGNQYDWVTFISTVEHYYLDKTTKQLETYNSNVR